MSLCKEGCRASGAAARNAVAEDLNAVCGVILSGVVPQHGQAVCPHGHREAGIVAEYAVLNARSEKKQAIPFAPLLRMTQW